MSEELVQLVEHETLGKLLVFHSLELLPGELAPVSGAFTTSYEIMSVAHGGLSHTIYVSGRARNGDDVVERWDIGVQEGGFFGWRSGGVPPIGVPVQTLPISIDVLGDHWTHPSEREGEGLIANRTELYRGSSLGTLRAVASDPDRRYVLAVGDALYRIDATDAGDAPVAILTGAEFPALDRASIVRIRELGGARVAVVYALADEDHEQGSMAALTDADNDGVYEAWTIWSDEEWTLAGYDDPNVWDQDFLTFF